MLTVLVSETSAGMNMARGDARETTACWYATDRDDDSLLWPPTDTDTDKPDPTPAGAVQVAFFSETRAKEVHWVPPIATASDALVVVPSMPTAESLAK